jgi:hypothetical protein
LGSDNKNTDKNKEARSELEQEIYDALNSETEFEKIPDYKIPTFNDPVEEILPIQDEVYFIELCNWLSNGYQQLFHKTYAKRDYLIRYTIFPPEQVPEPGDVQKQTWEPISEAALKLKPEPARNRIFHKSPQHHVFLISMLEAISKDTEKFIETYVTHTNKTLELKYAGGIQKCLEMLIGELRAYIERDNTQLLPVLYHSQDHGLMMSEDGYELNDNEDQLVFEFGFSKITSDNFTRRLILILQEKNNSINGKEQVPLKEESLDSTEKALIISYLQDAKEFITSHEQARISELVSLLTGSSKESVKKTFQKIHPIKRGVLTTEQAKARLKNLKKILPIFHRLELPEIIEKVQSRIKEVESFIK